MAKLYRHRVDGTYYTTRYDGEGAVTRRIHPDGVVLLKRRGIRPGDDVPPFAMAELVSGDWLYTEEDAARLPDVDWAPDWSGIGDAPAATMHAVLNARGSLPPVDVPLAAMALPAAAPARHAGIPMWTALAVILLMALAMYIGLRF